MFNPTWFYAGAVYAAAVTLARKADVEIPKRIAVFFYLLVFVFMYLPLTQDYVNIPVDFLKTLPPWEYTVDTPKAVNNQTNDITLQIVPWAHQVRESWKSFTAPLWNAAAACGYPLLASAQSSALSPLRILGLPLSLGHAMTFEAAMKILIALTFMFLWCRRRGYGELASTCGAVAFGFSSFILVWLHFPIATTACLVPAVFLVIDLLTERVSFARISSGAAVGAAMVFGGHPETLSHTAFMALIYTVWVLFIERDAVGQPRRRVVAALGAAATLAVLIAAPLLAPFAEAVTRSKRFAEVRDRTVTGTVPFADVAAAKLLVQPQFYGELPFEAPWGPAHAESISGFAGFFGVAAWLALIVHVVRTRRWRSREAFFVLGTLLVLGIILSWPGVRDLFHALFPLAANARMRLFLVVLLAVQTAAAIDLIARDRRSLAIGIGSAAALLVFILSASHYELSVHREAALAGAIPSFATLAAGAIAVIAARRNRERRALFPILALLVALTAELWEATGDWSPPVENEWIYPKTPLVRALDDLKAKVPQNEPFRIVANGPAFFPNVAAVYGYEDVRAHDPMTPAAYVRMLDVLTDYDPASYFGSWTEWEGRLMNFLNVRYVVTTRNGILPPRYALVYDGADGRIFENPEVLPRFYGIRNVILEFDDAAFDRRLKEADDWSQTAFLDDLRPESPQQRDDFLKPRPAEARVVNVRILDAAPTDYRLHVNAPRWSLVASSVPWWPGWKVSRNGANVRPVRVNGAFLGFAVPPGRFDIRVWYDPWTFRYGAILSLLTIAAMASYGLARHTRQTKVAAVVDA